MKIMLNFLPLATGGGVQVALDFLAQARQFGKKHEWFIVARESSPFSNVSLASNMYLAKEVSDNLLARLIFEYFGCNAVIKQYKPDVIYTQFGPIWPGAKCLNVAGCAYSNLFYPELDFWGKLPWHKKTLKKIIDSERLNRILASDVRIFETEDLAERAIAQYELPRHSVTYVRAAVSSLVSQDSFHAQTREKCERFPSGINILLLSGYHPNKNFELLIEAARILKGREVQDVRFILTLPKQQQAVQQLMEKVVSFGIHDYVYNFGPVPQAGCAELYRVCDYAILPSTLESFSNMIAESWAMQKPLLISDLSWCRSLCGDSAVYYDYLNPESLVDQILVLIQSNNQPLIEAGLKRLESYPTSEHRFKSYLSIIEESVDKASK